MQLTPAACVPRAYLGENIAIAPQRDARFATSQRDAIDRLDRRAAAIGRHFDGKRIGRRLDESQHDRLRGIVGLTDDDFPSDVVLLKRHAGSRRQRSSRDLDHRDTRRIEANQPPSRRSRGAVAADEGVSTSTEVPSDWFLTVRIPFVWRHPYEFCLMLLPFMTMSPSALTLILPLP
jgi:hypothetical protein